MPVGITNTGFVRKDFSDIENELQQIFENVFGSSVNTQPETPNGQLKAALSATIDDLWHTFEAVWQSRNISNLEGDDLDNMANSIMRISRIAGESDPAFIRRILDMPVGGNLVGQLINELTAIDGVTRATVLANDTAVTNANGVPGKSWSVVVVGGDDDAIAKAVLKWHPGGTGLFGNVNIQTSDVYGLCRELSITRPVPVEFAASITISSSPSECSGCAALDSAGVFETMANSSCFREGNKVILDLGSDVSPFTLTSLLPPTSGVVVKDIQLKLKDTSENVDTIPMSWFEYGSLDLLDTEVLFI